MISKYSQHLKLDFSIFANAANIFVTTSGNLLLGFIIHQWMMNSRDSMLAHPVFSQELNLLIQMSKRWKKYPTFNVRFPLRKHGFTIKCFKSDIVNIYLSTFDISQQFWFLKNRRKIYPTLYVGFLVIISLYFRRLIFMHEWWIARIVC